jgi:hypothetical protein
MLEKQKSVNGSIKKRLFFYFPTDGPGGVQSIIIRILTNSRESCEAVYLLDHRDCFIQNQIRLRTPSTFETNVIIVDNVVDFKFPNDACLVVFNWQLPTLAKILEKSRQLDYLYWDVHSEAVAGMLNIGLFGRCLVRQSSHRVLRVLMAERRLLSIDIVSAELIRQIANCSGSIGVTGIPININNYSGNNLSINCCSAKDRVNIVYIGRAVEWKVTPFTWAIHAIAKRYPKRLLFVRVYTDNKIKFSKLLGDSISFCSSTLIFEGYNMPEIIARESSWATLSIGMGTSQFELFSIGIPTLLIPATINQQILDQNEPFWVHLMPDFVFGFDDHSFSAFQNIIGTQRARLSAVVFEWDRDDLVRVSIAARKINRIYSVENTLKVLMAFGKIPRKSSTEVFDLIEVRVLNIWVTVKNRVRLYLKQLAVTR